MGKTILVIEDNPDNRKLAREILRLGGYGVLEAAEADSGIALARERRPDLILLDVQLPGMDGLAAARILKAGEETRHIPILCLTAFAMKGDGERFTAVCDGYIAKPLRYRELLRSIREHLSEVS